MILLNRIECPLLSLGCSVLGRKYKQLRLDLCNQHCLILYTKQYLYQQNIEYLFVCTETQKALQINEIVTKFEKNMYLIYLIVIIPVFNRKYVQKGHIKKYIWDLYRELILFLWEINSFQYIIAREIEGDILVWTPYHIFLVQKRLQNYNHLLTADAADFFHGGCNY